MSPLRSGETFDGGSEDRAAGPMPNAGKRGLRREIEDAFPHVFRRQRQSKSIISWKFICDNPIITDNQRFEISSLVLFTRSRI